MKKIIFAGALMVLIGGAVGIAAVLNAPVQAQTASWQDVSGEGNYGESCVSWLQRTNQLGAGRRVLKTDGSALSSQCVYRYRFTAGSWSQTAEVIDYDNKSKSDWRPVAGPATWVVKGPIESVIVHIQHLDSSMAGAKTQIQTVQQQTTTSLPPFSITVSGAAGSNQQIVAKPGTADYKVIVSSNSGYKGPVNLYKSNVPAGVTVSSALDSVYLDCVIKIWGVCLSPSLTSGETTLTVTANVSAPEGSHHLTITGTGKIAARPSSISFRFGRVVDALELLEAPNGGGGGSGGGTSPLISAQATAILVVVQPTLMIEPANMTISPGETVRPQLYYDADGTYPSSPEVNKTNEGVWRIEPASAVVKCATPGNPNLGQEAGTCIGGKFAGNVEGTATIKASFGGLTASATIKVVNKGIAFSPSSHSFSISKVPKSHAERFVTVALEGVGGYYGIATLSLRPHNISGLDVSLSASQVGVGEEFDRDLLRGRVAGSSLLTVRAPESVPQTTVSSGPYRIYVDATAPSASGGLWQATLPVEIHVGWSGSLSADNIRVGETKQYGFSVAGVNVTGDPETQWRVTDQVSSLSIDKNGKATGHKTGTPTIQAKYLDAVDRKTITVIPQSSGGGSCSISAYPAPSSSSSVLQGGTAYYVTSVIPGENSAGTYSLSHLLPPSFTGAFNPSSVAITTIQRSSVLSITVGQNAPAGPAKFMVTAIEPTKGIICSGEGTVDVVGSTLMIEPPSRETAVGGTCSFRAIYDSDGSGSASSQDITSSASWQSSNSSVAASLGGGVFRGVSAGTAGVSASYQGKVATASCNVTAPVSAKDFSLSISPSSRTLPQGSGATGYNIVVNRLNGHSELITLSPGAAPPNSHIWIDNQHQSIYSNQPNLWVQTGKETPPGSYTLTFSGSDNTVTRSNSVQLIVTGDPSLPWVDLKANGSDGPVEDIEPASPLISWTTTNSQDLLSCAASGAWSGEKNINGGTQRIYDLTRGSYSFAIACQKEAGGSVSDSVTVVVKSSGPPPPEEDDDIPQEDDDIPPPPPPPPPPPVGSCAISANPVSVILGQFSTLSWSCTDNVSSCQISGVGPIGSQGQTRVKPNRTTVYDLSCAKGSGDSATVNVRGYIPFIREIIPR